MVLIVLFVLQCCSLPPPLAFDSFAAFFVASCTKSSSFTRDRPPIVPIDGGVQ
jgi:hypothetical protein